LTQAPERKALTFEAVDEVFGELRRTGHRVTAAARLVVEALFRADGPISAEHIARGQGEHAVALEMTSVYRNLERLQQLGVVSHVHVGHGRGLYVLSRGRDCEYLVCDRCGRVTAVDPAALDPVRERVREAFGYDARFSHFPVHGYCQSCADDLEAPAQHSPDQAHRIEHDHGGVGHSRPH
jgi:Fur family ferric uptake transcriptional regulator